MKNLIHPLSAALLTFGLSASAWAGGASGLTDIEKRWLAAAGPVVTYARQQLLPVDIVVQPQETPGHAPMAMGFMNGRCKLVLSMRGNPSADSTMESIPSELFDVVAEAIAAHELAHCWRFARGAWHTLPAGFIDTHMTKFENKTFAHHMQGMQETRREEGFADLVGLAWTQRHHPEKYARVHAWFVQAREHQPMPGSHHDTRAWIKLASNPQIFSLEPKAATPFEQVGAAWQAGLLSEEEED